MRLTCPPVVVLSYGAGPVGACVQGLLDSGHDPDRLLVVHNPTPNAPSPPGIQAHLPVLAMPENVGYGIAMNAGLRWWRARGESVVVACTHDLVVSSSVVREIASIVSDNPDVAACGPVLTHPGGTVFSAGGCQDRHGNIRHRGGGGLGLAEVDWLDGSVLALDLSTGVTFREDFFLYWEDVQLGADLRAAGFRVICHQTVAAISTPGVHGSRAALFTHLMWRNRLLALRSRPAALAYTTVRAVAAGLRRYARPGSWPRSTVRRVYARAIFDGFRGRGGKPSQAVLSGSDAT